MKRDKIIFYILTGLLTLLVAGGASQYILNHEEVTVAFGMLQFPAFLIYPMAVAKISGLIAIWFIKSPKLKEWAYAGFTFNFLLAIGAHLNVGDGEAIGALIALVFLAGSYIFHRRVQSNG